MRTEPYVDPYKNFRFLIEIEGIIQSGFAECTGLSSKITTVEYREGGELYSVRKLPGQASYPDVTLKWGLTDSPEMYNWHLAAIQGKIERKSCSIIVKGDDGEPKVRWNLVDAWPNAWTGPSLNAKANEVAIEQMTLTCERIERGK